MFSRLSSGSTWWVLLALSALRCSALPSAFGTSAQLGSLHVPALRWCTTLRSPCTSSWASSHSSLSSVALHVVLRGSPRALCSSVLCTSFRQRHLNSAGLFSRSRSSVVHCPPLSLHLQLGLFAFFSLLGPRTVTVLHGDDGALLHSSLCLSRLVSGDTRPCIYIHNMYTSGPLLFFFQFIRSNMLPRL